MLQMKYRTRTYYTDAQKALMWERWKDGWTLHQIGHLFVDLTLLSRPSCRRQAAFDHRTGDAARML